MALVRKYDGSKLYAMKTLRKSDVLRRNQVAHVKAERDILAESDNDWVVKLYYSFQVRLHQGIMTLTSNSVFIFLLEIRIKNDLL